jgi:toxin YhaV
MQRHSWTSPFHEVVIEQLRKLQAAALRAEQTDPQGFEGNVGVRWFRALGRSVTFQCMPLKGPAGDSGRRVLTLRGTGQLYGGVPKPFRK